MANVPDIAKYMSAFKDEAEELLQGLETNLLSLEKSPNDEAALKEITRIAHTLKGSAKLVGLNGVSEIAHKMEDIFALCRDGSLKLNAPLSDVLFKSLDSIKLLVSNAGEDSTLEVDVNAICHDLEDTKQGGIKEKDSSDNCPSETQKCSDGDLIRESEKLKGTPSVSVQERSTETIRVETAKLDELVNLIGEMQINQIKFEERNKSIKNLTLALRDQAKLWVGIRDRIFKTAESESISKSLVGNEGIEEVIVSAARETSNELTAADVSSELLEDVRRYDEHFGTIHESLARLARSHKNDTVSLGVTTKQIQDCALSIRMFPVSFVFNIFPRAVRDMAREFNKKIRLVIEGGETELDKKVLEEIREPLLHIIRNAVDHGIEEVEQRKEIGKPEEGTIRLAASHQGDRVFIEVSDDGRGIDLGKVKEAAVKQGFVDEAQIREMSDRRTLNLIFERGFSTNSTVTEVSGRGMGMDIVKQKIDDLEGEVRIESKLGHGTKVTLSLPLTLVMVRVLLVSIKSRVFAIPTASVEATAKIRRDDIKSIEGKQAIIIRKRTIPIVPIGEILGLNRYNDKRGNERFNDNISVVITSYAENQMGFIVDGFIREQEIVIKSLPEPFPRVRNVAGATILSNGDVVSILHIPDLFASARAVPIAIPDRVRDEESKGEEEIGLENKNHYTILIVEDSLTTRELERSILTSAGYDVDVACDGLEGLQKVNERDFDLIISDIQMPRMDGFEMTQRLKQDNRHKDIPVIIMTTLERDEDKKRGLEVGADAYMVKSAFDQTALLEAIQRLV